MNKEDAIGTINYNNFGSKIIIIDYRKYNDIDVYFPEYSWTKEHVQYINFINGRVKCPYERTVFNIGYVGEGKYNISLNGKHTKCYNIWNRMLSRCYDSKYIQKHPTYEQCEVCEEWHNFQNFAQWFENNYYEIDKQVMNLDKDILIKHNKVYSPETCVFVPQNINKLFTKRDNNRGSFPVGVSYNKRDKKYKSYCNMNKKQNFLGYYDTPEEAFQAYKQFKENYIKQVADEYKDSIPEKLYNAMYEYEVEIED